MAGAARGPAADRDVYARSLDCVHCGLCLQACPTYRETGRETSSPRGRIYLMRGVAEGHVPLEGVVAEEMYLCLGCRACETACPSGVEYGAMLEEMRARVEDSGARRGWARRVERFVLRRILPHPWRLGRLLDAVALAQRLWLDRMVAAFLPRGLREARALLPEIPPRSQRRGLPELIEAEGERRGRVALFAGCIMPELFGDVNAATARTLARNGFDVVVPRDQGCCGALHAHAGDESWAHALARRNVRAFREAEVDAVIVNSAGCGAAMREAERWLGGDGAAFAASVRDVAEFLDSVGLRQLPGRVDARVCYDDPCHLVHGQGVGAAPRRILAQIPGVVLVEHDDPTSCCGAAGIYNLTHRRMSEAILERKLDAFSEADPDVIATGNPGCLMQIRVGAKRRGLRARVLHPVELLDAAYL